MMKRILQLLAPWVAVAIFWCGLSNAWLAILAYHAQIVFWSWGSLRDLRRPTFTRAAALALPAALAGPLLYFLLPHITHTGLSIWLADHRLSGIPFLLMIPYFGLLHPALEQLHWTRLREETPLAHPMFAGYHVLVLHSLLTIPWLVVCFLVLVASSVFWRWIRKRHDSLAIPVISHVLADLGIVIAAWLRM